MLPKIEARCSYKSVLIKQKRVYESADLNIDTRFKNTKNQ